MRREWRFVPGLAGGRVAHLYVTTWSSPTIKQAPSFDTRSTCGLGTSWAFRSSRIDSWEESDHVCGQCLTKETIH
jgi:hypothetical protein